MGIHERRSINKINDKVELAKHLIAISTTKLSIRKACEFVGLHRSSYYNTIKRVIPLEKTRVVMEYIISSIFYKNRRSYGIRRIYSVLQDKNISYSYRQIRKIMNKLNLRIYNRIYRYKHIEKKSGSEKQNLLGQIFKAKEPNQIWLSDLTYIKTKEGWMFLVAIIDLFTRKVVGYSIGESPNSDLVIKALKNAVSIQRPKKGIILHSDRGIQFTSEETTKMCKKHRIIQSFSALGCPYDNAPMESFFATLKKEEVRQNKYKTIQEAKLAIFEYIEGFYNLYRKHSALNYKSPQQFTRCLWYSIFGENLLIFCPKKWSHFSLPEVPC